MKTENTSVTPEAAAAKQPWSEPTLSSLSVSMVTMAGANVGMDANFPNVLISLT